MSAALGTDSATPGDRPMELAGKTIEIVVPCPVPSLEAVISPSC